MNILITRWASRSCHDREVSGRLWALESLRVWQLFYLSALELKVCALVTVAVGVGVPVWVKLGRELSHE